MDLFNGSDSFGWLVEAFLWIAKKHIEIFATITGFIYLIYSIEGDIKLWFFGLVNSALFVYIFFNAGIYADMSLSVYYVLVSIYGWIHWSIYRGDKIKEIPYSRTNFSEAIIIFLVSLLLFILMVYILKYYTNSTIPYLDSFTTALSITATWMLARKMIEHWLLWVVVDAVSIGMYIYKGLYPTSFLFGVYTVLAVSGFITWKKKWKLQQKIL
jgi:nicotinamide mononucleotide transporter